MQRQAKGYAKRPKPHAPAAMAAACRAASSTSACMLTPCAPATWVPQRSVGTRIRVARLEPTLAAMSPVISPIMESLSTSAMGAMRISAFCAAQRTAFSPARRPEVNAQPNAALRPGLEHGGGRHGIGAHAEELRALRQEGQKGGNDGAADAAALSVQDDNGHMKASVV